MMEDWLGLLPISDKLAYETSGVFQRVGEGDSYVCRLCSRNDDERISTSSRRRHVEESIHRWRAHWLLEERDALLDRANASLRFYGDLKRFRGNASHMESGICRYIFFGEDSSLADVEQRSRNLRASDPMVLLDLALWKAACQQSPTGSFDYPLDWKAWYQRGWKAQKSSLRRHPFTGITALVAPFLGLKKEAVEDLASVYE
jgi:hypothetical protein